MAIVLLFTAHWVISAFFQSFFHHRYASHRMFTMAPRTASTTLTATPSGTRTPPASSPTCSP